MEEDEETQNLRKFKKEGESFQSKNENSTNTEQPIVIPEVIYNTHKFMYSLYHKGKIKGHIIEFTNREGKIQSIELVSIEIGASPVSAKFYDTEGKRHLIPFLRVHKVFKEGELVWEEDDTNKDVKVIKGI